MMAAMFNLLIKRESSGVTGALPYDALEYSLMAACTAIAWAFTIELDITAWLIIKPRSGLYFWSLLICSWGCALHALGFLFKFLVGTAWSIDLPFIEIGWVAMVSGQALVLYSRLYLVIGSNRILHCIFAMIIINALWLHIPIIVFTVASNDPDPAVNTRYIPKFNTMERIQLVGFSVQECIISSIYIYATARLLRSEYQERGRRVMARLVLVNIACIAMDVLLVGLEFSDNYVGEASVKPLIYAIKLRLEFVVYRQMMAFAGAGFVAQSLTNGTANGGTGVGQDAGAYEMHSRGLPRVGIDHRNSMKKGQSPDLVGSEQVDVATTDWKGIGAAGSPWPANKDGGWSESDASTPTVVMDALSRKGDPGIGPEGEVMPAPPKLKARNPRKDDGDGVGVGR